MERPGGGVTGVMVQGPSGVIAVARDDEPLRWSATKGEVRWPSGAVATVYSSEAPESLRGPEHHLAWCDELAKWRHGEETWDNLQLTMRLGKEPRVLVTTTPRATTLMKRVMTLPDKVETRGNTRNNPYVPASFVAAMVAEYGGKRLGRQELDGELIEDVAGALWTRALLERQRVRDAPAVVRVPSTPGRVLGAPDRIVGATRVEVFELPNLDDTLLTQPRVLIAAAGTGAGWRRAALLTSLDDGASWTGAGATALPATMGTATVVPGAGPTTTFDLANTIEVELLHGEMTLESTDDAGLDAGRNLAMVGGELLQFGSATQLSATRWRLARLLRARRGVAATHAAGERFVLVEPACVAPLMLPASAIGRRVRVLASGIGDAGAPAEAAVVVSGASVAPPAPVQLRAERSADGGARVTWVRRSRLGWSWRDGGDAPLGEEREAYRLTVAAGAGVRSVVTTTGDATLSPGEVAAGALVTVRQLGTSAESAAAGITVGADG